MTKHLYRLATSIQEQLLGAAMLHGKEWPLKVPRVQLDAWAALWAWHRAGEPVARITEEEEHLLLSEPLSPDLRLADVEIPREVLACQMPDRRDWVIVARIPALTDIIVQHPVGWRTKPPLLVYVTNGETVSGYRSGYYSLADQPTPAQLQMRVGTLTDSTTERQFPMGEAAVLEADYRASLAITKLYRK